MYNHQLDTFIVVADVGSFNKAAEELYISPNAVMKQINLLEAHLGFPLFERTHRGLNLTPAGKSFYQDAKYIIQYSKDSIHRAINQSNNQYILRVGVSFTTPVEFLVSLWSKVQKIEAALKFELVSFENTPENAREIMQNFGKHIDMVAGIYSENLLKERKCSAFHLYDSQVCCCVPISHPLANKSKLVIEDLFNEQVMMLRPNYLSDFDIIRNDLERNYPNINIKDLEFFNVDAFNRCVNDNTVLLGVNEWKNIHPMLKIIPIEWEYSIPFGIMYSNKPTSQMELFLKVLTEIYK